MILCLGLGSAWGQDKVAPYLREKLREAKGLSIAQAASLSNRSIAFSATGKVQVYVHVATGNPEQLASALRKLGAEQVVACKPLGLVQAWVSPEVVETVAGLPMVSHVGLPVYGRSRIGLVTSEGDAVLNAAPARSLYQVNGDGARVGVISDGVSHLADSQATGDLPAEVYVGTESPFSRDEGTAMLEIVHDIAPMAALGFSTGWTTADFINSVGLLKDDFEADIIVDDIGFDLQPYFEDGEVALAAQAAAEAGVLFISAAGNESLEHYEADFSQGVYRPADLTGQAHNFASSGDDVFMDLGSLPNGSSLRIVLQWNEPFASATSRYRLRLYASIGESSSLAVSQNLQALMGGTSPYACEILEYTNSTAGTLNPQLLVEQVGGVANRIEIFGLPEVHEYLGREGSVYGHPAALGVVAVAATRWTDLTSAEVFSQAGPSEIYFPSYQIRQKPDLTSVNGIRVTGVGGFNSPFYGTSAAAPHIAGIAALLLDRNYTLTAGDLRNVLTSTAIDMTPAGWDDYTGAGLAMADVALGSVEAIDRPTSAANWTLYR